MKIHRARLIFHSPLFSIWRERREEEESPARRFLSTVFRISLRSASSKRFLVDETSYATAEDYTDPACSWVGRSPLADRAGGRVGGPSTLISCTIFREIVRGRNYKLLYIVSVAGENLGFLFSVPSFRNSLHGRERKRNYFSSIPSSRRYCYDISLHSSRCRGIGQ